MWSRAQLDRIFQRTGLRPPLAFLSTSTAYKSMNPAMFEGHDSADDCDPLYFHSALADDFSNEPLIAEGFLPFWQENNCCETVLIGCKAPFIGCIGARGILTNEDGGLVAGSIAEFFEKASAHTAVHSKRSPSVYEIVRACAFHGIFSSLVTERADAEIRKSRTLPNGREFSFYGAMSENLALELLASEHFSDVEVAAWRLGGLLSRKAIPLLEPLAARTAPHGKVDQHFRAAARALQLIKSGTKIH